MNKLVSTAVLATAVLASEDFGEILEGGNIHNDPNYTVGTIAWTETLNDGQLKELASWAGENGFKFLSATTCLGKHYYNE